MLVATIQVIHAEIQWGETGTSWTISSSKYFCEIDNSGASPQTYWWYNGDRTEAFDDCYRTTNVDPYSPNECCPSGYKCDITSSQCVPGATVCGDFTDSATCENFDKTATIASYEQEVIIQKNPDFCSVGHIIRESPALSGCYDQTLRCSCYWNEEDNICYPTYTKNNTCTGGEDWQCKYFNTITANNCNVTGTIDSSWEAVLQKIGGTETKTDDPLCASGSSSITCLSTAVLTFIGIYAIIIVILLIIIFYIIKYRNRKNRKKKKR